MAPPPATIDHVAATGTVLPLASLPTATNCCLTPAISVSWFGVTVMLASDPFGKTTVAVAVSVPLVALTVLGNVPDAVPAVNRPVASMLPPPATTDQAGVTCTTLPLASRPTTLNCWLPLIGMYDGFGVTVMLASDPALTTTVAVAESAPLVALTVLVNVPADEPE